MQRQIAAFAEEYDVHVDQWMNDQEGQLSINHPLLYVFIGDKSLDALNAVYDINQQKWHNSKGILYVHFYTDKTVAKLNVFSVQLPAPQADRKTIRKDLAEHFHQDTDKLVEFNHVARQISNRIAEYGKVYASFQRLQMAVVTRIDDPCNVLLQEIVLLLKSVLSESFKLIQLDMYGLMKEKQEGEAFAYSSSLGISFLHELERYQSREYSYNALLQVTEDLIRLPVEHTAAPLFDLVYLLSDKNEQAMFPEGSMETNYEIIANLNVLKNRKVVKAQDSQQEAYNNQDFRQHIHPSETKGNVYATAGFSKIKRPNHAIALTVLAHFYQGFLGKLMEQSQADKRTIMELLQLDVDSIERKVYTVMPGPERLAEMGGLLSNSISFDELRRLTLQQAEEHLYGGHAEHFFEEHFGKTTAANLQRLELESELQEQINRKIIHNPIYGLYSAYAWTSEREDAFVFHELRRLSRDTAKQLEEARVELSQVQQESVEGQPFQRVPFMNKANVKKFIRHLFDKVYGLKLEMLFYEMKLKLLRRYELAFEKLHESLKVRVGQLHDLEKLLKDASRQSVSEANDYLGRNIPEYYSFVVDEIIQDLQAKRGDSFYFEERYMGNVDVLLAGGTEALLRRLMEVCKKEIFTYPQFRQSFEDELLKRANVTVKYEDKDLVLTKEDLYRDLYKTLEDGATVHIDVYNYTHKHRYEEKYYFADFTSEFIQYAFAADQGSRLYKLGCVDEKKNSGIEKLHMMGGFQLSDLMFIRNGSKYYESYKANGFQFHAAESDTIKQ